MAELRCLCDLAGTSECSPCGCPHPIDARIREEKKRKQWARFKAESPREVNGMFHELGGACEHVGKLTDEEVERLR